MKILAMISNHDEDDEEPAGSFGVHPLLRVGTKGQVGRQVPVVNILLQRSLHYGSIAMGR